MYSEDFSSLLLIKYLNNLHLSMREGYACLPLQRSPVASLHALFPFPRGVGDTGEPLKTSLLPGTKNRNKFKELHALHFSQFLLPMTFQTPIGVSGTPVGKASSFISLYLLIRSISSNS